LRVIWRVKSCGEIGFDSRSPAENCATVGQKSRQREKGRAIRHMTELPWVAMRKVSSAPFRGMVVVDSTLDHFLQNDGDPDALFQHSGSLLKSSRSTRSALVNPDPVSGDVVSKGLYVKEFRYKGAVHSFKPLFGKHRAQVMWKVSWHLLNHSIPVPEPEGYLLKQRGPICLGGYYFSKALILVDEKDNQLWLIDLDASKICGRYLGPKGIARDLARFVLSGLEAGVDGTILARFLHHYAQQRNLKLKNIEGPMMNVLQKLRKRHEKKLQSML
jgi:hypothetical protein